MKKNEDLIVRVQELLAEVDKTHRYSMSRIYALYNEAYGTAELAQSCASCLIRKIKQLKTWLKIQEELGQNVSEPVSPKKRRTPKKAK